MLTCSALHQQHEELSCSSSPGPLEALQCPKSGRAPLQSQLQSAADLRAGRAICGAVEHLDSQPADPAKLDGMTQLQHLQSRGCRRLEMQTVLSANSSKCADELKKSRLLWQIDRRRETVEHQKLQVLGGALKVLHATRASMKACVP